MKAETDKFRDIFGEKVSESSFNWNLKHQINKSFAILKNIRIGDRLQDRFRTKDRMLALLLRSNQEEE